VRMRFAAADECAVLWQCGQVSPRLGSIGHGYKRTRDSTVENA